MARQIIVLALVFVAIVGVASAATEVEVAKQDHSQGTHNEAAKAPAADDAKAPAAEATAPAVGQAEDGEAEAPTVGGEVIGATDDAAPTGELGPAAAEAVTPVADKENGASALSVPAAVAGVVAVAGFLSF